VPSPGRVEWREDRAGAGRSFLLHRPPGPVPGVLWSPPARGGRPPPAALLFHGGSGHKRSGRHLRMAPRLAAAGLAVIALDAPWHGDRASRPLDPPAYQALIAADGIGEVTGRVTAEWLDAVAALGGLGLADAGRVSVFGMSMGARFGLPAAAALGGRLRCAVLGKFGISQSAPLHPGLRAPALLTAAARAVSAPVLYHVQRGDELFPLEGQLALFGALGSADKRLAARAGPHGQTLPRDEESWTRFLAGRAAGDGGDGAAAGR